MTEFTSPFPKIRKNLRKVINVRIFTRAVVMALAILGMIFILLMVSLISWLGTDAKTSSTAQLSNNTILTVNFDNAFPEYYEEDLFSPFPQEPQISFYEMIKAINIAATDDRIKALVAEVNMSNLGAAQIQELRRTIKYFRSKGKKTYMLPGSSALRILL